MLAPIAKNTNHQERELQSPPITIATAPLFRLHSLPGSLYSARTPVQAGSDDSHRGRHHREGSPMIRTAILSAAIIYGVASGASAGVAPAPIGHSSSLVVKVAEGCGPGFWRGAGGRRHPFAVNRACPVGYHLGPEGKRCWPN
jgi:hypothetical protein